MAQRVQAVYVNVDGHSDFESVDVSPGESVHLNARLRVVDGVTGELVASPSMDLSVDWQIRGYPPLGEIRSFEQPWIGGGASAVTPDGGTVTADGTYTAPAVRVPSCWVVLVYALPKAEQDFRESSFLAHPAPSQTKSVPYLNYGNILLNLVPRGPGEME